jgi:hypothetical protein
MCYYRLHIKWEIKKKIFWNAITCTHSLVEESTALTLMIGLATFLGDRWLHPQKTVISKSKLLYD